MKRIVIACVLVAVAIFIAVFGYFDISSTSKKLILYLDTSKAFCENGNYNQSLSEAEKAVKVWKEKEKRYKVYLNHDELDELEVCFEMLELKTKENTEAQDFDASENDITELLNEGIFRLRHLIDSQKPKLSEIF